MTALKSSAVYSHTLCISHKKVSLVLFGSCIAHGMFPMKERLSSKSPKRQKEDFSVIHNKIGNPVANLLKYLSY